MRTKFYFVILVLGLFILESSAAVTSTSVPKCSFVLEIPQSVSGLKIVTGHPDLKIKVSRCEASGTTCVLDLLVTNYAADANIRFSGGKLGTKVYDDEGNVYTNLNVEIQPAGAVESSCYSFSNYDVIYPTELPVKFRIIIKDVANAAKELKRISLKTYSATHSIDENPIMLYNIPISREGDE